ncbi:MAG: hypothetical protein ABI778_10810, partial [Ignavibacteriota bacterium]
KTSTMRTGLLPEGTYELCITLVSASTMQPVSQAVCRNFSLTKNILPVLLQPEDKKKIVSGTEKTTLFVWSPMIPVPQNPVIYRLRVVDVLQGQTVQQAFNINTPLFERTVLGATQMLWPQEIPLPDAGVNLAWGVQPEDNLGNPYIIPERFTNAFNLFVFPTKEECAKMLEKIKKIRDEGLLIEESYWLAYDHFTRVTEVLEAAEERADILAIDKARKEQKNAEAKLSKAQTTYDAIHAKYDSAIAKYEECIGK